MMRHTTSLLALMLATSGFQALQADDTNPAPVKAQLVLIDLGPNAGYVPHKLEFTEVKPAGITNEPVYEAKPVYAQFHLGNGPRSAYTVVLDAPDEGDYRLFVDLNQNGDLTDDDNSDAGPGAWQERREYNGNISYSSTIPLRASYGTATKETSTADLVVTFYTRKGNTDSIGFYGKWIRQGTLTLDGKEYQVGLQEYDGDAVFNKPAATVEEAKKTGPVYLNGSAPNATPIRADIRGPFMIGEKTFEAKAADDGSTIELVPSSKPYVNLTPPPPPKPKLLANGTPAPDYMVEKPGGGTLKLSELRGKVVILDFWATWCGPCQASMPHLEEVYKKAKEKGVEVLAVCVWDSKKAYQIWAKNNKTKYTFPLAYDPSGRGEKSAPTSLWHVSGIPCTYIIDKEGTVAEAIIGYNEGGTELENALKKLGVSLADK